MGEPPEHLLVPAPEGSQAAKESCRVGQRIASCEWPALLLDVLLPGTPIVGASRGFRSLTGRDVVGSGWEALLEGVDKNRISRSMCQDVESFLRCSRLCQLCSMADAQVMHVLKTADGDVQVCSYLRLVKVEGKGLEHRLVLCLLQEAVKAEDSLKEAAVKLAQLCQELQVLWPNPMFFPAPLSNKCIMLSSMSSAMRREAHLPRGCVAMSNQEIEGRDGSFFFRVTVDGTTSSWSSRLPFLGFTTTSPEEVQRQRFFFGSLPHAFCLGESALVGGAGEAWLRGGEHRVPKLKESLETGAERRLLSSVPEHRRVAPFVPRVGDQLGCRYLRKDAMEGSKLSLFLNGAVAFEFDFQTALPSKPLYAVVDVCHCVNQVTMMPLDNRLMGS